MSNWTFDGDFIIDDGEIVCQLFDREDKDFLGKAENGPLIAAAPELLAACKGLLEGFKGGGWHDIDKKLAFAQAAIAAAEGTDD